MSDNKALVIGGGNWQVPIIEFLKEKNYKVTVADPYDNSPGSVIADARIKADVRDPEVIKQAIRDEHFDIVTSDQSDIAVETVARIAEYLEIKGNKLDVVRRFTNKYLSRQYASEINMTIPQFRKATSITEVREAIEQIGLPVILKPVDSQSSRGIFLVREDNSKLDEFVAGTFSETRENYILVEEFIVGTELTVEGICCNGKHKTLAISGKKHFRTGIASDLRYPAMLPTAVETALIEENDRYVEHSGLEFGITHAEYMYVASTGKCYLVEIACRGGGTLISSHIAKWVSGVDIYELYTSFLTGKTIDVHAIVPLKRPAILHFFEFPNGVVTRLEGIDEISRMEGVVSIKLDFKKGDHIKAANDDRSRQGSVIILADSEGELNDRLEKVNNTLKVEIESV